MRIQANTGRVIEILIMSIAVNFLAIMTGVQIQSALFVMCHGIQQ
ncbi:MAG: hypothetical protein ACK5V3_06515 [Bdellovibrionales bacterium]